MFLDIDGNRVFTLSFGRGPRTLLVHGGWISNVEDWIATLAPLGATWRTVVYDHRGAGLTRVPVGRISPEALVDDVFRVMDAIGMERCVLGGFSRGTITAMRAALAKPERFDGLVLLDGCGEVRAPGSPVPPRVPPSHWPGETHEAHLRWFVERCTPEAADRLFMMEAAEPVDWARRLPTIGLPALIVHGELDASYRIEHMRHLQSLIPDRELVVMEGCGHLPAMTRPVAVAAHIERFFAARGV